MAVHSVSLLCPTLSRWNNGSLNDPEKLMLMGKDNVDGWHDRL